MEFLRLTGRHAAIDGPGGMDVYHAPSRPAVTPALREDRVVCAGPECSSRWKQVWKDRRRPIFERRWGCSARCMQGIVEAAVRRETGGRNAELAGGLGAGHRHRHRHRIPLGLMLLAQGVITNSQLQHALEAQRRAGTGRIGRWLIDEFGLKEECVTRALSVQWSCPVLPMEGFDPRTTALTAPRMLVEKLGLVPLRIAAERILYLAFEDGMDAAAALAIERMSGLKVESGVMGETQLKAARERLLACEFIDATVEQVESGAILPRIIAATVAKLQPTASRLVRVHEFYWMRMWLESGAMRTADGGVPASGEDVVDRIYTIGNGQPK